MVERQDELTGNGTPLTTSLPCRVTAATSLHITINAKTMMQTPAPPSALFPRASQVRPKLGREITSEESEGILFAFETLDVDRTGYVTTKQLKVALRALGFEVHKADVLDLLSRHGEEDAVRLDFPAFRRLVVDMLQQRSVADDHRRAFQLFDVLGQGAIDFMTLKRVVKSLNIELPDEELQDMITEFGKDGFITEQEWLAIMNAD